MLFKKVVGHPTSGQAAVILTALTLTAFSQEGLALRMQVSVGEPLCPAWMWGATRGRRQTHCPETSHRDPLSRHLNLSAPQEPKQIRQHAKPAPILWNWVLTHVGQAWTMIIPLKCSISVFLPKRGTPQGILCVYLIHLHISWYPFNFPLVL